MKTLNEVIKAMEDCAIGEKGCLGCAYEDIHLSAAGIGQSCVEAMIGDALWYLKNYRDLLMSLTNVYKDIDYIKQQYHKDLNHEIISRN